MTGMDSDDLLLELVADGGRHDPSAFRDEPTVRGKFVRDVSEAPLPAAMRDQVLRIGLSALDGRSNLWPSAAADGWE
jgi:hypothetical protein